MRTKFVIATLLMTVLLICSCGGGSGSDSDSSAQKAVAVGFDINMIGAPERIISASDPSYTDVEFWYRAIPKWTSTDGFTIQGDTRYITGHDDNNFVKTTALSYNSLNGTIGYFAQGKWAFDIEVRKPLTSGYAVLWRTTSSVEEYINSNDVTTTSPKMNIDITVVKNIDSTKKGKLAFNITAPKTSATDLFEVSYLAVGATGEGTTITGLTKGVNDSGDATLTGNAEIDCGIYAVTVKYYSDNAKAHLVGISTVAAEVIPFKTTTDTTTISGSIENGKWQQTAFTIKGMYKLTIGVTATGISDKGTVHVGDVNNPNSIAFECTPTIKNIDGTDVAEADVPTYTYEWRINGAKQNASTKDFAYTMASGDANSYVYVDCIAYFKDDDNNVIGSASNTFRLVVEE